MLKILKTNAFDKDIKLAIKRGLNLDLLVKVIDTLANNKPLAQKYKDHTLFGEYNGYRECHIKPDWLLIYIKNNDNLYLVRTGSHSDLFK